MKAHFIFPPISNPRAPHLVQACLAAKLKVEGHTIARNPEKHALQYQQNENTFSLGGWSFETNGGMSNKAMKKVYRKITGELYNLLELGNKYSGWEEYSLPSIDRFDS